MKKIIHFKYDPKEYPFNTLQEFYDSLKDRLQNYTILITPFDVAFEDENDLALSLNGINYTHAQLEQIVDKAQMYDGLCN